MVRIKLSRSIGPLPRRILQSSLPLTPWYLPCCPPMIDGKCPNCLYDLSIDEEEIVGGSSKPTTETNDENDDVLDNYCSFCIELPDRPVTTPCGHNFCLECFKKWMKQGKQTCPNCRTTIPTKMASTPRINTELAITMRMAKLARSKGVGGSITPKVHCIDHYAIRVTIPKDHFGPIVAENDPTRNRGVLVGDKWKDRMECRQWGAHFPHIARVAGQKNQGAQSVVLSGGYTQDEDHGEWFTYTGSGGRNQFLDHQFNNMNEALRLSCRKGYPVRVVRSHKEKQSSYAPEAGVRYDGVYRIDICWSEFGKNGEKVCRYLFVRCDNEPAPWTSDLSGDYPRPLPFIEEFRDAVDIIERNGDPSWDFDEEKGCWLWKKPPPLSKRPLNIVDPIENALNPPLKRTKGAGGKAVMK